MQALQDAFEAGWRTAAEWAQRDDLLADIGSPRYLLDMANALMALQSEPAAAQERPSGGEGT